MRGKKTDVAPYIDKLVNAIAIGATYEIAALYAGISHDTFARWRKAGATAKPGTPLANLHARLTEAEGRAAVGWLARIESEAANGDWKAAAWKLERRYPESYGRTMQKIAFTTPDGLEPAAFPAGSSEEFFRELADLFTQLGTQHMASLGPGMHDDRLSPESR
jgi:hypothetical protein